MKKRKLGPFKNGDRVAVYALGVFHGPGFHNGRRGTVYQDQQCGEGSVLVRLDEYDIPARPIRGEELKIEVYPQQLRRLKPKKAPAAPERERVERFAIEWAKSGISSVVHKTKSDAWAAIGVGAKERVIHLVELREGERILSRADLEKAWAECFGPGNVFKDALPKLVSALKFPVALAAIIGAIGAMCDFGLMPTLLAFLMLEASPGFR